MNFFVLSEAQAFIARPKRHRIKQNADIVAVRDRLDRVGNDIGQQGMHDFIEALRNRGRARRFGQNDGLRKQAGRQHRQYSG